MIPNITVKDGVLEVGSNLALESIEKIGYIQEEGYNTISHVDAEQSVNVYPYGDSYGTAVLPMLMSFTKAGQWHEVERSSLPPDVSNKLSLMQPVVSTEYGCIAFYDYDQDGTTKCWSTQNTQAYLLNAKFYDAFDVPSSIPGAIKSYQPAGFKPFFTKAQYQAILNLIK